jgi:hypothetical protein
MDGQLLILRWFLFRPICSFFCECQKWGLKTAFRVDNLRQPAFTYVSAHDHDHEADSNGNNITVNKTQMFFPGLSGKARKSRLGRILMMRPSLLKTNLQQASEKMQPRYGPLPQVVWWMRNAAVVARFICQSGCEAHLRGKTRMLGEGWNNANLLWDVTF